MKLTMAEQAGKFMDDAKILAHKDDQKLLWYCFSALILVLTEISAAIKEK